MKNNIKLEIIGVAKRLFNERGYNDVSTQNIADAMGISKGNLNYHFKKKEDIIEAVVEEMHSHYVRPEPPATLAELNALFLRAQRVAQENAFYFWHYTQLSQMSERIREIQGTVFKNTATLFSKAFKLLNEEGSLKSEEYLGQYEQNIQMIMLACTYWTPYSRLEEGIGRKGDFLNCVWGIICPILTDKGKAEYMAIRSPAP